MIPNVAWRPDTVITDVDGNATYVLFRSRERIASIRLYLAISKLPCLNLFGYILRVQKFAHRQLFSRRERRPAKFSKKYLTFEPTLTAAIRKGGKFMVVITQTIKRREGNDEKSSKRKVTTALTVAKNMTPKFLWREGEEFAHWLAHVHFLAAFLASSLLATCMRCS
jgi:hypothetical protein